MGVKFSIIGSAIRSNLYKRVCENVDKCKVPYEIIFAGFNPPTEKMPDNFKYIVTHANPALAVEMCARHAVGEYLMILQDDTFVSDGYLDRLNYYVSKLGMENSIVGGRYKYLNKKPKTFYCDDRCLTVDMNDPKAPMTTTGQAWNRELWNELGGIDSRFTGVFYDIDMAMRFYEHGLSPFVMPDAYYAEDRFVDIPHSLYKKTGKEARELLNKLWIKDGQYSLKRSLPVIPSTDEQIKDGIEKIIG